MAAGPFDAGVIVLTIPIIAIICGTVIKIARLRANPGNPRVLDDLGARVDMLEHEVGTLRQELGETQERLDFTERLLSAAKEGDRLKGQG